MRIPISVCHKSIFALFLACLALAALPARAGELICDDFGVCAQFATPPRRVIALYGALSEILLAMGCGDLLAGRTSADAAIPALAHLPAVGTHMRPNAELIAALKPDLILQMAGRGEARLETGNLRKLGLAILTFDIRDFPALFAAIARLGKILEREPRAGKLAADWQNRLAALPKAQAARKPRVYYEAREPSLLAAGTHSMVNAIIEAAGGENAVRIPKKLARCNEEELLLADPDICLLQKGPMSPNPRPLAERPALASLRCVKNGLNFIVDEHLFARPGPGSIAAAEYLARIIAENGKEQ